jgi:CelD/BcsL family acetyltransferase involved in cellulose biosynthesis
MPRVLHLKTVAELLAAAPAWDDLWQRSDCTSPLARAKPIADWLDHFAPSSRFQALVIADEDRWLFALPLMERRMAGVLRAGVLPCNAWPSGATLLWDAAATNDPDVSDAVSTAVVELPWSFVFLEAAMPARASWQAFYRAVHAANMPCDLRTRWQAGRLAFDGEWADAFHFLSRKHRQRVVASLRKLKAQGKVRFKLHAELSVDEVEPLLRRAWATEDRGWKGADGTSVLRTPGAAEFMLSQARDLAAEGRLRLALLDCGPRNVAFSYGVLGKGVYHSFKIGYDPAFASFSPGHLLQYHLLEGLYGDPQVAGADFIGELTEYHASWRPQTYPLARLAFARRGRSPGRMALWAFQCMRGPSEQIPPLASPMPDTEEPQRGRDICKTS